MSKLNSWTRIIDYDFAEGTRGRFLYFLRYKEWEILLNDDGYNAPSYIMQLSKGKEYSRIFTDANLREAKYQALTAVDKRVLRDEQRNKGETLWN